MARIVIENLFGKVLEIQDINKTLLQHFQAYYLDWMHACGGKGRCTTCKIMIREGMEHCTELTEAEHQYRAQKALSHVERLSCQVKTSGDLIIRIPDECKLPHITYSN